VTDAPDLTAVRAATGRTTARATRPGSAAPPARTLAGRLGRPLPDLPPWR